MKITNVKIDNIKMKDFPDFCDAFIVSCEIDGRPATEQEVEELNKNSELLHELVMEKVF